MARQETIRILRSEVLSATPSLTSGEVAVNLTDRKFFIGGTGGTSDRITFRDELSTVQSVNGQSRNIVITGDSASMRMVVGLDDPGEETSTFVISNRIASTSLTGVASFYSNDFFVSQGGEVSISTSGATPIVFRDAFNNTVSPKWETTLTLTGGNGVEVHRSNAVANTIIFRGTTASAASSGVASFLSDHFTVSGTGHVTLASAYQATGDSVQAGSGIVIGSGKTITNIGVTGIGFGSDVGLTGKVNITAGSNITITKSGNLITFSGVAQQVTAVTGDGASIVGRDNSNITARLATTSLTGVASFNATRFSVSNGAVDLATAYQATGDTVITVAGSGIALATSGKTDTIYNIGVTGFNGLTGNITVTGDGESLVGIGNNKFTNRLATTGVTGVASFNSSYFSVSSGAVSLASAYQVTGDTIQAGSGIVIGSGKTITNIGVTGFNGLTGNITVTGDGASLVGVGNTNFTNRLATTGVTGVASFNSTRFSVLNGAVDLAAAYQATGDTIVAGSNITIVRSNNQVTINGNEGLASSTLTGVASFNSTYFSVASTGHVTLASAYQATGDTVQAGSGIVIGSGKTITNIGVTGIGFGSDVGLTGKVNITAGSNITITQSGNLITFSGVAQQVTAVTGDGASIVGRDNSNITARVATTGVTGVASFSSTYFSVSNGAVSLASAYQATGDTVITVAGSGIALATSGKTDTIYNIGVTGFNGLTGNITVTGDGGSLVGLDNNKFTNRLATTGVTGVASFNATRFSVSNGAVDLAAAYQATGDTVITVAGSGIALATSGRTDTIFNIGVTGFNGLTGNITVTGDGGSLVGLDNNKFTNRLATTGVTGVASFNATRFSVLNGAVDLATAYQATGDTIVAGSNITIVRSNNQVTVNANEGLASTSATGVASFNSTYFSVSSGAVSLASAYQATGDTVITVAGSGIALSTSGKTDTIFNIGVTGFNGLTGNITVTGDGGSLVGKDNNRFTNRFADTSVTGVASFDTNAFVVTDGHVSLRGGSQGTLCGSHTNQVDCENNFCYWCDQTSTCSSSPTCGLFTATYSGVGASANADGSLAYLYFDPGNLTTGSSTTIDNDSDFVLFYDASEPGLVKTKRVSPKQFILDSDALFASKTTDYLQKTKSSTSIDYEIVTSAIEQSGVGLVVAAEAFDYISLNTVKSLNGLTGDVTVVGSINGCTGAFTITGTVNEVVVSTGINCRNIIIGLPDNVTIPYISGTGATFTGTVNANLFIGSVDGGTF